MIDFELTEEQRAIQTLARDFAEKEIKPIAAQRDKQPDHKDCFDWDVIEKGSRLGFRTLTLDKKYGGAGLDSLTTAIVLEELARGDLGVSVIFAQTVKIVQFVQWSATEQQCRKFFTPFRDDHRFLLATTSTEADVGSDLQLPYAQKRLTTTARLEGNEWVINGTKQWSSGAPVAKMFRVLCLTDQGEASFLIPRDTPGVKIGAIHNKVGERFAINSEVIYENVRVPKDYMTGGFRKEVDPTVRYMRASNAFNGACATGLARAAFENALEYAKVRIQGGKPIAQHEVIGTMLAQMWGEIEAARLLYYKAAWMADRPDRYDPKLHALAKTMCSETAMRVTLDALQIYGGYGSSKDFPMEKYLRDAVAFLHSDSTNQLVKIRAGNCLAHGL